MESDDYSERLVADIVLQNGDKMLCVEPLGKHARNVSSAGGECQSYLKLDSRTSRMSYDKSCVSWQ